VVGSVKFANTLAYCCGVKVVQYKPKVPLTKNSKKTFNLQKKYFWNILSESEIEIEAIWPLRFEIFLRNLFRERPRLIPLINFS